VRLLGFGARVTALISQRCSDSDIDPWGPQLCPPWYPTKFQRDVFCSLIVDIFSAHTSIGLLALAIELLEANPHKPHLFRSSKFYDTVICVAEHAPDIPQDLKVLALKSIHSESALRQLENILLNGHDGKQIGSLLSTTQAVDLVEGGNKANALPDRTSAVVNHRISAEKYVTLFDPSSICLPPHGKFCGRAHLTKLFMPFALEHNLTFIAFGNNTTDTSECLASGAFELINAWDSGLEPSPIAPTNSSAYRLLSGSILATHAKSVVRNEGTNKKMIVAPALLGGNTGLCDNR